MTIQQIKHLIDSAPHGEKCRTVKEVCDIEGIGKDALYRKLRKNYGAKKTIKREKKIDRNLVAEIAKIKVSGEDLGLHSRELSTEDAIDILVQRGVKGADKLSVSTVNTILRYEKGFRVRKRITMFEAERPNQTHGIDFSRSEYFQLFGYDNERGEHLVKVSRTTLNYKNKEKDKTFRTWLVGAIDNFSRVTFVKAYAASGESVKVGTEFLIDLYNREEDDIPLRYVPEKIKIDNGSFGKSKEFQRFCKSCGIKVEFTTPNKSRGNQKLESKWKLIWRKFELKLAIQLGEGAVLTLTQYNELLHEALVGFLERKHPRRAGSVGHVYRSALVKFPPRELKVSVSEIMHKVYYPTVKASYQVTIKKVIYNVPVLPGVDLVGKKIRVSINADGDMTGELIHQWHKPFILRSTVGFVNEGDYSGREDSTYKEKLENQRDADRKQEKGDRKVSKIQYMPVVASEVEPDTPFRRSEFDFIGEYEANQFLGVEMRKEGLDILDYTESLHQYYLNVGEDYFKKKTLLSLVESYKRTVVNS